MVAHIELSPTLQQVFNFPNGTEVKGCCGCFHARPRELLVNDQGQLQAVRRATRRDRRRAADALLAKIEERLSTDEVADPQRVIEQVRQRAGSVLSDASPITLAGIERVAHLVMGILEGANSDGESPLEKTEMTEEI